MKSQNREWDDLPYVTSIYNKSVHGVTKETPHFLLHGQDPIEPDDISGKLRSARHTNTEYHKFLKNLTEALEKAKANIDAKAKTYYDQHAKEHNFKEGTPVFLKTFRRTGKFHDKFQGPYIIVKKIGDVNYVLCEPKNENIRFIVHVNRIKPYEKYRAKRIQTETELGKRKDQPEQINPGKNQPKSILKKTDLNNEQTDLNSRHDSNHLQQTVAQETGKIIDCNEEQRNPEHKITNNIKETQIESSEDRNRHTEASFETERVANSKYNLRRKIKKPLRYRD